jgi:hypothetical protein
MPQARLELVKRGSSVKEEAAVPKLRRLKRKKEAANRAMKKTR